MPPTLRMPAPDDMPEPDDDESQSDFLDRCVDEMPDDMSDDEATAACMIAWNDASAKSRAAGKIVHKTVAAPPPGDDALEFIMSDASVDRYGDVIAADGWQLGNFRKNPVALFSHDSRFPIGTWSDTKVINSELRGRLTLMPPVTDRLREIHAALQANVLRAVSVGFHAIEAEPLKDSKVGGIHFLRSELVECSLVAVPANANALQVAKSLNLSRETQALIFGKPANEGQVRRRGTIGKPAGNRSSFSRTQPMLPNLTEKIEQSQARLNAYRDQLTEHVSKENDDMDMDVVEELNLRIGAEQRVFDGLKASEALVGTHSEPVVRVAAGGAASAQVARPFALPKREIKPVDYIFRSIACAYLSHVTKRPLDQVMVERYGDDEPTRVVMNQLVQRAASVPATTTLSHWASELVSTIFGDFVDALMPMSVYAPLSARGGRFSFDRAGSVILPTRNRTPNVAGAFYAEGSAIPVKQGAFSSITLTPRSMGVISTFTRRLAEHSTPSIEAEIRQMMQDDTSIAVDTILLDSTAGDTTRPPGLLNGVGVSTASSSPGFTGLVADIKMLLGVLTAANSLRSPTWIMNPSQALSISLTQNTAGDFPFKAEIVAGTLQGYPVLQSTTVTAGTVILVDAADFFSATGDEPNFDVSDQAVLHMEDSAPQAIGVAGSATLPIRSLWQTDSIGIRMRLDMSWAMRRTGVIAYTTGVAW